MKKGVEILFVIAFCISSLSYAQSLQLVEPLARAVHQRNNENNAMVPVSGTYVGQATVIEARATVMDGYIGIATGWQVIDASPMEGTFSGYLSVEAGGWYQIEVRMLAGEYYSATVERVGVGEVFLTAGQSNAANYGLPAMTPTYDTVSAWTGSGWRHAYDPLPITNGTGGSPWSRLSDMLSETLDIPIGFIAVAVGGTNIERWLPYTNDLYPRIRDGITAAGENGLRAILWHQGEADTTSFMTESLYASRLSYLIGQSRVDAGRDVAWGVAIASDIRRAEIEWRDAVRGGQINVINNVSNVFAGPDTDIWAGTTYRRDTIHFNELGLSLHATGWEESIIEYFDLLAECEPPVITDISPLYQEYLPGQQAQITVLYDEAVASVDGVIWYRNNSVVDVDSDANISVAIGQGEVVLTIDVVSASYTGVYHCVITNDTCYSLDSANAEIALEDVSLWTGAAGTNSWSNSGNWYPYFVPTRTDVIIIEGNANVLYDGGSEFERTANTLLYSNAKLQLATGKRFLNARYGVATFEMDDNSELAVDSEYFIVGQSGNGVFNQYGGTINADISRAFYLSDHPGSKGTYNLSGGQLVVTFSEEGSIGNDGWNELIGKNGNDTFFVNGGAAIFDTKGNRRVYLCRNSVFQINSGFTTFNAFERFSVGRDYPGLAQIIINGGVFNVYNTLGESGGIVVGDYADGKITVNGGKLNVGVRGDMYKSGLVLGRKGGSGTLIQTGGDIQLFGLEMDLGWFTGVSEALYEISGGTLTCSKMRMYPQSVFNIRGSGASLVSIQEFEILSQSHGDVKLKLDIDRSGVSLIKVGSKAGEPVYNGGAKLDNLTIEVEFINGFEPSMGTMYDILWATNDGIHGYETINLVNSGDLHIKLRKVDAYSFGYSSGELLQLRISSQPIDPAKADFTEDGRVDIEDLKLFLEAWLWTEE